MLIELSARRFVITLEFFLELELFLPGGQLDFFGLVLGLNAGILAELVGFGSGTRQRVLADGLNQRKRSASTQDKPDKNPYQNCDSGGHCTSSHFA